MGTPATGQGVRQYVPDGRRLCTPDACRRFWSPYHGSHEHGTACHCYQLVVTCVCCCVRVATPPMCSCQPPACGTLRCRTCRSGQTEFVRDDNSFLIPPRGLERAFPNEPQITGFDFAGQHLCVPGGRLVAASVAASVAYPFLGGPHCRLLPPAFRWFSPCFGLVFAGRSQMGQSECGGRPEDYALCCNASACGQAHRAASAEPHSAALFPRCHRPARSRPPLGHSKQFEQCVTA